MVNNVGKLESMEPQSVSEWKRQIQKIWDDLSHELVECLVKSLPKRMRECIEKNGATVKH
jgi:hypothetical protein